jgi:DNA repair protein RadA/Sms
MGKCPGCGKWNTMVEEVEHVQTGRRGAFSGAVSSSVKRKPEAITTIKTVEEPRIFTKSSELNRVLGGGIVKGSLVLIGGDPGIGKSTLLLQCSAQLAVKSIKFSTSQERNQQSRQS